MSAFLTRLEVELTDDTSNEGRGAWKVTSDLVYESDVAEQTFTVPAGFLTDFASVPRIPFVYAAVGDCAHEAATLHDWLYTFSDLKRSAADAVLKEAMVVSGVTPFRCVAIYIAVRLFGASHWNK